MGMDRKCNVDDRDRDVAERVRRSGGNIQPEEVAVLRTAWPHIVKEVGKLEDRMGVSIPLPRSVEDLILAIVEKKDMQLESVLKNVDLSVIPLTDDLRKILQGFQDKSKNDA